MRGRLSVRGESLLRSLDGGIDASLVTMAQRQSSGEEPPKSVAEAMKAANISVLLTTKSLTHTVARRDACEKHGARIASMPGADAARLETLLDLDYDDLRARSEERAGLLENGRKVRLSSSSGSDLTFANLTGATIAGASLSGTRFGGATGNPAGGATAVYGTYVECPDLTSVPASQAVTTGWQPVA